MINDLYIVFTEYLCDALKEIKNNVHKCVHFDTFNQLIFRSVWGLFISSLEITIPGIN